MKILSILITCYGIKNDVVRNSLKSVEKSFLLIKEKMEVIFTYKNSEIFNYDWVEKEFPLFKFLKVNNFSFSKNFKIKSAAHIINGKYFLPFDPDDFLISENIIEFISLLEKHNESTIICNAFLKKENSLKEIYFVKKNSYKGGNMIFPPANFNTLFLTSKFNFQDIEYDGMPNQDLYITSISLQNGTLGFVEKSIVVYNANIGESRLGNWIHKNNDYFNLILKTNSLNIPLKNYDIKRVINRFYFSDILGFQMTGLAQKGLITFLTSTYISEKLLIKAFFKKRVNFSSLITIFLFNIFLILSTPFLKFKNQKR